MREKIMKNSKIFHREKIRRSVSERFVFAGVFLFFTFHAFLLIYPVIWGLLSSLKDINGYFDNRFGLPALPWKFLNYSDAVRQITDGGMSFINMFWNSTWFSAGSAIINMEFVSAYAYVLNKYKFRGRNFLYGLCLFIMSVPLGASFVSTYRIYYGLHLANSYAILFTATAVYGMNLMLFHSYYSNISNSYKEAAQIDGANFYQIYFKAMRPQALPLALTLGIMQFIAHWNDYMSPLLYLPKMPTLATGLYRYQTIVERNGNYPVLFAGLFICLMPILVIFLIFSDRMMANINVGGLKG